MDLLGGNIKKTYFKYLATSIGSALVVSIYSIVDCVAVGQYQGPDGSAALAIVMPIWSIVLSLGLLCGIGGAVHMSKARGEGEKALGDMFFSTSIIIGVVITAILWVIILIFDAQLLTLFGASENILPYALDYLKYLKYFLPLFTLGQILVCFVRNDKAPGKAMGSVVCGGVFNIIGDYLFVFVFDMGVAGAGLATALGQLLGFCILLTHFMSKKCTLRFVKISGFGKKTSQILGVGFSTFIIDIAIGVTTILFNNQIVKLHGESALAVFGVIVNINFFVQSIAYGVGQSAQPMISMNYGAKQPERIKQIAKYAWISAVAVGVISLVFAESLPLPLTKLFMKVTPEVEAIAPQIFRVYCIYYILLPLNIFSAYYLLSIMRPKASLAISLLRSIVLSAIMLYLLPAIFGKDALWISMTVSEAITFVIMLILTVHYNKKLKTIFKATVENKDVDCLFEKGVQEENPEAGKLR